MAQRVLMLGEIKFTVFMTKKSQGIKVRMAHWPSDVVTHYCHGRIVNYLHEISLSSRANLTQSVKIINRMFNQSDFEGEFFLFEQVIALFFLKQREKEILMEKNMNTFVRKIALNEEGVSQVSIGNIKEIVKYAALIVAQDPEYAAIFAAYGKRLAKAQAKPAKTKKAKKK